jgi:hydroxypyruvate reductase
MSVPNWRMREILEQIYRAGLEAVAGHAVVRRSVKLDGDGNLTALSLTGETARISGVGRMPVRILSMGKAAASMVDGLPEPLLVATQQGLIICNEAVSPRHPRLTALLGGHPEPTEASWMAGRAAAALVRTMGDGELLVVLLSGGASSLSFYPHKALPPGDVQAALRLLASSGADIEAVNIVRRHLCEIKGGRLAAMAAPAQTLALVLSDVPGDGLHCVGSGPTVPDPTSFDDAVGVLKAMGVWEVSPLAVREFLRRGQAGQYEDTPKPGDPVFQRVSTVLVGNSALMLRACADKARSLGIEAVIDPAVLRGEAADQGAAFVQRGLERLQPLRGPCCFLSGGETTVTRPLAGTGGRNQEFALAAAWALKSHPGMAVLSAGTDGKDGPTPAAGAFAYHDTVRRALSLGLSPRRHLDSHDSYLFFLPLGDLLVTGHTGTNVADVQILLNGCS